MLLLLVIYKFYVSGICLKPEKLFEIHAELITFAINFTSYIDEECHIVLFIYFEQDRETWEIMESTFA